MNRKQAFETLSTQYPELKDSEKTTLTRIFNKLLQVNYITRKKESDLNDYHFILATNELIEAFLKLIGFELVIKKQDDVIYIKNEEGQNHLLLKKNTTIIALALRLMYQEKITFVTLSDDCIIYLSELHDKLAQIGFIDNKRITKKDLKPELALLKNYNIIAYSDPDLHDSAQIKIYPTIKYICEIEVIDELVKQIEKLVTGEGIKDEETN